MRHDAESRRRGGTAPSRTVFVNRPRGLALIGLLTVLDGAWGAIVPFIGPLFGFRSHGQDAWQLSSLHGTLYLAPGAVAVLFGLIILARARSVTRGSVGFAGLVVAACGAWFVVGPALWPTFGTGPVFTPAATAMDNFIHQVGYNLGVGVILAILGGMALKALARDREVAVEGREPHDERLAATNYGPGAGAVGREPAVYDRRPAEPTRREPTRREPMMPATEPVGERRVAQDRVAEDRVAGDRVAEERVGGRDRVGEDRVGEGVGEERLVERDPGPIAPSRGVGNRSLRQRDEERVRREGGDGVPPDGGRFSR